MQFRSTLIATLLSAPLALSGASAFAQHLTHVPSANPRIVGVTSPTVLSPELAQIVSAQGSMPVENPVDHVKYYGYLDNQPNLIPAFGSNVEASKTEPDKNTYLVLHGLCAPPGHLSHRSQRRPSARGRPAFSCAASRRRIVCRPCYVP